MPQRNSRFAGARVLLTGAAGLIGKATALRLAQEGAGLVISDISERRLLELKNELVAACPGTGIQAVRASVLESEDVALLARSLENLQPIDGLINLVGGLRGGAHYTRIGDMDEARWNGTFELNLKGIYHLVRAFAPAMAARGRGCIVNAASIAFQGDADQPEYAAAKAAIVSLTRSFAMEFAPHVRVNCVAPGFITDLPPDQIGAIVKEKYIDRSLLKRAGTPDEIAAAIAFLASCDASYITGTTLAVAGGIWPAL